VTRLPSDVATLNLNACNPFLNLKQFFVHSL
jgi:hypothetical protein